MEIQNCRDRRKKDQPHRPAQQRRGLHRHHAVNNAFPAQSRPQQQRPQRQSLRYFMHAHRQDDGKAGGVAGGRRGCRFLAPRRHGQAVHRAVNRQRQHHGRGDLAEPVRGGFVEMAGRAGGANMKDVSADHGKEGIAGRQAQQQLPPVQPFQDFGQDGEHRHSQERSRPDADQRAQPLVRSAQGRAQHSAAHGQRERQNDKSK